MVKEKGAADGSLFTTFKRRMANTNISNNDKEIRVPSSSRVSVVSENPEADTILTSELSRFGRYFEGSRSDIAVESLSSSVLSNLFRLNRPAGVAVDGGGNVLIADQNNNRIRRVDAGTGIITTIAGNGDLGGYGDGGPGTSASLNLPYGVAVDGGGNVLIADRYNNRIRRLAAGTGVITTVAGNVTAGFSGDGGPATDASLAYPFGVAVDGGGNVLIADRDNHRIRRVAAGTGVITTVAGTGGFGYSGDGGPATDTSLNYPTGVAVDGGGNVLIADTFNNRIRRVDAVTDIITTVAGTDVEGFNGDGGPGTSASLNRPAGVAVDSFGNIFIADTYNHRIRRLAAGTGVITTVAGNGVYDFSGDGGPATTASLALPSGVAVDASGNLFIADSDNFRIRRVDAVTGIITTLTTGFYDVGQPLANSYVSTPSGVTVYGNNIYISVTPTHTILVVNKITQRITNVYGTGIAGVANSPSNLTFNNPYRTAVGSNGDIYVADWTNNRIRRINVAVGSATQIVSTSNYPTITRPLGVAIYGNRVYFTHTGINPVGTGIIGGTMSSLVGSYSAPEGLAVDSTGNVYVANTGFNKITRVTPGNIATDIQLPDGVTLNSPRGVAIDSTGQLHIADSGNTRVIRLNTDNTVTVLATGLNNPYDLSVDTDGSVYVADTFNNRIVKIKETITKFSRYV